MGCTFFWVKFCNAFAYFVVCVYYPDGAIISYKVCKTKVCLFVPGRHGKYIFTQKSFYLQGILNDINEQNTSFLD